MQRHHELDDVSGNLDGRACVDFFAHGFIVSSAGRTWPELGWRASRLGSWQGEQRERGRRGMEKQNVCVCVRWSRFVVDRRGETPRSVSGRAGLDGGGCGGGGLGGGDCGLAAGGVGGFWAGYVARLMGDGAGNYKVALTAEGGRNSSARRRCRYCCRGDGDGDGDGDEDDEARREKAVIT